MNGISKLFKKTDGLLLRCLGLRTSTDMNNESQISQGLPNRSDFVFCPWDTVFVQDVSFSMTYKDYRPSRLNGGQQAQKTFVRMRAAISPADRVAIVSFALSANIELPLTDIIKTEKINAAVMKLRADNGTDITPGIEKAWQILKDPILKIEAKRLRRILLLTDGRGGNPLILAEKIKNEGILIDVIGIGGKPSAVDETLLRRVATTDRSGFTHYWFIKDADSLATHYQQLATSLAWRSDRS